MKKKVAMIGVGLLAVMVAGCGDREPRDVDQVQERPGMAYIPAGQFYMGCSPGDGECLDHEKPRVKVGVDGFYMDINPVAQAEYEKVAGENPSYFVDCGPDCPADTISWVQARDYCEAVGKRLPTEAEWERAARGGAETRYFWGDEMDGDYAWSWDNAFVDYPGAVEGRGTQPVGLKKPNQFGLHDMLGGLWEWVEDCFDPDWHSKLKSGALNPVYECTDSSVRVLRGGAWGNPPTALRASFRRRVPAHADRGIGFRCAAD